MVLTTRHRHVADDFKPKRIGDSDGHPLEDLKPKSPKRTRVQSADRAANTGDQRTSSVNTNLERKGRNLRLLLKQIVQAKVKDGNEMSEIGPIKEQKLVQVLYEGMKQDIEVVLHHPEDIASWQKPPNFSNKPLCYLVKEAESWILYRAHKIGYQAVDASVPKIARRAVLNVVSRMGKQLQEMSLKPDWDPGDADSKADEDSKVKPTTIQTVHQLLPGPLKDVVLRVVTDKFLDFDKEIRDALVKVLLRIGTESVLTVLAAPEDLGTGEKPPSDRRLDYGELVDAYEDVLLLTLDEEVANSEQVRPAAEQLAWSSRSRLDVLIDGLLDV